MKKLEFLFEEVKLNDNELFNVKGGNDEGDNEDGDIIIIEGPGGNDGKIILTNNIGESIVPPVPVSVVV